MSKGRIKIWLGFAMLGLALVIGAGLASSSASAGAPPTSPAPSWEVQLKWPASDSVGVMRANRPARMFLGSSAPSSPSSLGDLLWTHAVEAGSGDNVLLGVQYTNIAGVQNIWVTGRSSTDNIKQLHKFDQFGNFVSSTTQDACVSSTFGWRDLAYDGTNLVTADECGVDLVSPATGLRVGGYALPGGALARAMAYNPGNGHCYTANFNSVIIDFNCATGVVSVSNPADGIPHYGFGFDSVTAGGPYLWSFGQQGLGGIACPAAPANCLRATRLTLAGVTTGVAFDGQPGFPATGGEVAGGTDVAVISGTNTLIALHQASVDIVRGYDLVNVGPTSTPTVTPTATNTRTPLPTPTCRPQLIVQGPESQKPGQPALISQPAKSNYGLAAVAIKTATEATYLTPDSSFQFVLDDGTFEQSVGFGAVGPPATESPAIWLNKFTPSSPISLPLSIDAISIFWPGQSSALLDATMITSTARLLVYLDTDSNNNPNNATLVSGANAFVTVGVTGTFRTYNLDNPIVITQTGDIYAGFEDFWAEGGAGYQPRLFPAALDTTGSQVRSWVAGGGTIPDINVLGNNATLGTIDSFGLPGNWGIRISGDDARLPHCLPTFTPGASSTRTQTRTPTQTPTFTKTPEACGENSNYVISASSGTLVLGTTLVAGSQADDDNVPISIPFTFDFYKRGFPSVNADTNGNLQFSSALTAFGNACLPQATLDNMIAAYWDDLNMAAGITTTFTPGIYTSTSGTAPNRIFNIEWRACIFDTTTTCNNGSANFEVRLYEGQNRFDLVYGASSGPSGNGLFAVAGAQRRGGIGGNFFVQYECGTGGLTSGLLLTFTQAKCPTTPTPTPTCVPPSSIRQTLGLNNKGKANVVKGNNNGANRFAKGGLMAKSAPVLSPMIPNSPISFALDDGTRENSIGFGQNTAPTTETAAIWLNRFSPGVYNLPMTINSISILWPDQTTGSLIGRSPRLLVYQDPDGDNNPANATLMGFLDVTIVATGTYETYPVSIPVTALTGDVYIGFEDRWAEGGLTPRLFPAAQDETDPQVRSWTLAKSGVTPVPPDINNLGNNDVIATIDSFGLPGNWMIRASGVTADRFCTANINGHLTWQGINQPLAANVGLTGTMTICVNGLQISRTITTDINGNFSLTVAGIPDGSYNWSMKGRKSLRNADAGTLVVVGGVAAAFEAGTQKAGDCDNSNVVGAGDFNILKNTFGKAQGDPGYDERADFNNSTNVNASDFNLQKGNFGQAGLTITCP